MSWFELIENTTKGKVTKVSPDGKQVTIKTSPGQELKIDTTKDPDIDISTSMGRTTVNLNKKKGPNVGKKIKPGQQIDIKEIDVEEGPNDPNIFKAVFMAGSPGSGKSFVAQKLLKGKGLKFSNSDDVFEYMLSKAKLEPTPDNIASDQGQEIRDKAKQLHSNQLDMWVDGRLGLVIDGTGRDPEKVAKIREALRLLGYETMMLFVNTSLEVAQDRNKLRSRQLPSNMVRQMWDQVQQNIMQYQQIFSPGSFFVIDNSGGLEDPARQKNFDKVEKAIRAFLSTPIQSQMAKSWIDKQKPRQ